MKEKCVTCGHVRKFHYEDFASGALDCARCHGAPKEHRFGDLKSEVARAAQERKDEAR